MEGRDSNEVRSSLNGDFGFGVNDRRFAFSRQASFQQSQEPHTLISIDSNGSTRPSLSRSDSSIHIPWGQYWTPEDDKFWGERKGSPQNISFSSLIFWVFGSIMSGHRYMKRFDIGILVIVNSVGSGMQYVLCLGLVSVSVFMLVLPLFRTTSGILLQMAPPSIPTSALSKCLRQITAREEVLEVSQARFWELVPGHVVGSISLQVKKGIDDCAILGFVHVLYQDLSVHDPTVQIDSV